MLHTTRSRADQFWRSRRSEGWKEGDVGLLRCLLKIPWDALGLLRLWTAAAAAPAAIRTRHKLHVETGSEQGREGISFV